MRIHWLTVTSFVTLVIALSACAPLDNPESPSAATLSVPVQPSEGKSTPMSTEFPTPLASGMEHLVQMAKADLAQRLSISTEQISLVEAGEVEWSDSSLDCPQPDMAYIQVITPGYRILLQASGTQYEYHSNRDAYVVYCESPIPPFLPKP